MMRCNGAQGSWTMKGTHRLEMNTKPFFVRAEWDHEALVWIATSDDVPGLSTESDTLENLVHKLKIVIPELLEANGTQQGCEAGAGGF